MIMASNGSIFPERGVAVFPENRHTNCKTPPTEHPVGRSPNTKQGGERHGDHLPPDRTTDGECATETAAVLPSPAGLSER
jgi:hypothetical protein